MRCERDAQDKGRVRPFRRHLQRKNFLGKELTWKGIKVNQSEEGVEIDVHIIVKYHAKIPAVAWDIQENVKNEVQEMTELKVTAVNIHVEGVEIPAEEIEVNDEK